MTKNKNNKTPFDNGEFLDSNEPNNSLESTQSYNHNLENKQEQFEKEEVEILTNDVVLDNEKSLPELTPENINDEKEYQYTEKISIPLTLSKNITSTKKYKVLVSSDTKFVLDLEERGGASYSHTTYTKSLNFKTGDYIEEPKGD